MDINKQIKLLPNELQSSVEVQWQSFVDSNVDIDLLPEEVVKVLAKVWACSDFVMQTCVRFPELFLELVSSGDLLSAYSNAFYKKSITFDLKANDITALNKHLRKFRRREMLRIVWRDIAGWADLNETMHDLSLMAEACIDFSLSNLYQWQCKELGVPVNAEGVAQELVVLGMGKLGAWELNVSSDIDLIFTFAEEGEVKGGSKSLTNSEFFSRLGKKFIQALDQQTEDGFVFRVDMRLRPFGQTGPLVSSFSAFENYYLVHGRSWERYAMVKVRVVGGDRDKGKELLETLKPFVYRRYLDYGAYESLRELKEMIKLDVQRKGMSNNVKLGAGGIREVEFIAQVFQLIRGGRDTDLQERRVLFILDCLSEKELLPDYVVRELKEAYVFLRNTEHRIQEYQDRQTHNLPEDKSGKIRLAFAMGFDSWSLFLAELDKHRENVESHFEQVFVAPQIEAGESKKNQQKISQLNIEDQSEFQRLEALWYNKLDEQDALVLLEKKGFREAGKTLKQLKTLHQSRQYASLSRQGQTRLDRLMPLLLGALQQVDNVDITFERILSLLSNVARRSVYLALLLENPMVLSQLIKLCSASPWIARYLQQLPVLLDELMDPRSLYQPPIKIELEKEARLRLAQLDLDDVEQSMDALRYFKQANVLRVAAADIAEALPLMSVSNHLSWIAEVVLAEALEQAWQHLVARHGKPVCKLEGELCDKGFAIVGYGKLGGYELGYGSDLDMVFLHSSENSNSETLGDETKGKKPIAVQVFFARLGQRIIHLLTAHTSAGVCYEADMRLRPDGASGLLVTNLKSYRDYQLNKAWLWEHQALVRARVVAGDAQIASRFAEIRREVLSQQRNKENLRKEVLDMRNRMRKELSKEKKGLFDLKQGLGGIVDIEFMVQYGVLAWAFEKPKLLEYTDNIRLLEALSAADLMSKADVEVLSNAYRTFRARLHKIALQEQPAWVDAEEYSELSTAVRQIWRHWLEEK